MASQPNILFLITDQQRVDTLGCYGNPVCRTPNVDRMAAGGVRFDQAYTPTAICTPARASLITGVMPFEHKLLANFERNVGYITELPPETVSFAHHLRRAGYNVGSVGKWHIGMERGPEEFGFDGLHYPGWGQPVQHPDYVRYLDEHGFPHFRVRDEIRGRFPNGQPGNAIAGIYEGPVEASFPYFLATRTIEALERYAGEDAPFFLACQWFGPHLPYYIPEAYAFLYDRDSVVLPAGMAETFEHKPMVQRHYSAHWTFDSFSPAQWRDLIARYWGYVTLIDEQVGRILAAVERLGLADSSVTFFTSDHGAFVGSHKMQDKGPAMYDDIYRIPLVARLPGGRAQAVEDRFVSLVDLSATFLDLAGAEIPVEYAGRSLVPLLRGDAVDEWREHIVAEFHGHHFPYPQRMIRTRTHKLIVNPADVNELYDLVADPYELTNQIDNPAYASVRRDLYRALYNDLKARGDNFYHWMTSMFEVGEDRVDASLSQYKPV
jgi:arylsulfatase A-like enzyme